MVNNSIFAILTRKQAEYQLLIKVFDIFAPINKTTFRLKELLCMNSFSWTDKLNLKAIFGGDYSSVIAPGMDFTYFNGKWLCHKTDYKHFYATKILSLMQKKDCYTLGSIVYPDDLKLIEVLISHRNEIFAKELGSESGEEELGYEITEEILAFISNDLKQRIGRRNQLDYDFVRAFLESLYEYDEFLVLNTLKEEDL